VTLDFDRWFQRQAPAAPPAAPALPDGLWNQDGKLMARCNACENDYEWPAEPHEYTADMSYCGGSPRCLP
jgi:hypothetical protein